MKLKPCRRLELQGFFTTDQEKQSALRILTRDTQSSTQSVSQSRKRQMVLTSKKFPCLFRQIRRLTHLVRFQQSSRNFKIRHRGPYDITLCLEQAFRFSVVMDGLQGPARLQHTAPNQ